MTSREVLEEEREAPTGSHTVAFHATRREGAEHAASFLSGAPPGQAARSWVPDQELAAHYSGVAGDRAPDHVGCVAILPTEQVERVSGKLRPAAEVREFLPEHPEGVTAAGDTISSYWTEETGPDHLEYEAWFDRQPRDGSRFLCPYDLRAVPPGQGAEVMRQLGAHHSHVVLAQADEPGARLLELFLFESVDDLPPILTETLAWAVKGGLVAIEGAHRTLGLTPAGETAVRDWEEHCTLEVVFDGDPEERDPQALARRSGRRS